MVRSTLVALACLLVLASAVCADSMVDSESIVRPTRPKNFASPDDLRLYLDQLGQYFAVIGRPRFGKRVVSRHSARRWDEASDAPQQPRLQADLADVLHSLQDLQLQGQ